jgi:predicted nucleotidyltransferase
MLTNAKLTCLLKRRLRMVGLTYSALDDSNEIVVFGSHALGVSTVKSDLDVLVVGSSIRINHRGLDLISVSSDYVRTAEWLGSELAAHISAYGVWLHGEGGWKELTAQTKRAELMKTRRIERLLTGLIKAWRSLHPIFHSRYRLSVRRELQRLYLLRRRIAIPPGAVLDSDWKRDRMYRREVVELTKSLSITPRCLSFVLEEVLNPARFLDDGYGRLHRGAAGQSRSLPCARQ